MCTFKIFIASSAELSKERKEFREFIATENDRLNDEGIYFKIIQWEYFLDAISKSRLQDEYNKAINSCDIFISLFYSKAGKYTIEEFNFALNRFQKKNRPFIFTYFKDGAPQNINDQGYQDLLKFKKHLSDIGHFPTHYNNTDDLKNKFRQQLDRLQTEKKLKCPRKISKYFVAILIVILGSLSVLLYNNVNMGSDSNSREVLDKLTTEVSGRLQKFQATLLELPSDDYYNYRYIELAHMVDGTGIIDHGSASPERPVFIFSEYKDRTMQSLLYEIEQLTKDKKEADIIKEGRKTINEIQNSLIDLKSITDRGPNLGQRLQQIRQISPHTKLSPTDSIEMVRYNQEMIIYKQKLQVYHAKTKITLDSIGKELLKNTFLKKRTNG
ncbi:MAG: hypothetical protein AB8F94_07545 [Saprospiraceae bacterium]